MDIDDLAPRLEQAADRVGPVIRKTVKHQGSLLNAAIRRHASGRPGPNIITRQYWSSWKRREVLPLPDGGETTVATDRPQGKRLEFGFWDMTDSIGRHFYQPAYPHVGPAIEDRSPHIPEAFRDACDEIFGEGS